MKMGVLGSGDAERGRVFASQALGANIRSIAVKWRRA
jgi:hypothetical protein